MITVPPKDQNGHTIPHDHQEVSGSERFIRRISEQFLVRARDGNGKRLSSATLTPSSPEEDPYCGLSGDLEALIIADNLDPRVYVTTNNIGAISLAVEDFRNSELLVGYDPLDENKYHGAVWPNEERSAKLTEGKRKKLMRQASWYVSIPGVRIVD